MNIDTISKYDLVELKQLLAAEQQELSMTESAIELLETELKSKEGQLRSLKSSPLSTFASREPLETGHGQSLTLSEGSSTSPPHSILLPPMTDTIDSCGPIVTSVLPDHTLRNARGPATDLGENENTAPHLIEHYRSVQMQTRHQLELLSMRRDELEARVQQKRIQLNGINRLSFDVLSAIQQLVIEETYVDYRATCESTTIPSSRSSPFQVALDLASVSVFWCSVAISSPRLWRYITFDFQHAHRRSRENWRATLSRSLPYAIEVFLIYCPLTGPGDPMEVEELETPDPDYDPGFVGGEIDTAVHHDGQREGEHGEIVDLQWPDPIDLPPGILDLKNDTTRIQHLHFIYDDRITAPQAIYELSGIRTLSLYAVDSYLGLAPFHIPPTLTSIRRLAANSTFPLLPAPVENLTCLSLDELDSTLCGNRLLGLLDCTPNLKELHIGQQSDGPCTHPTDDPAVFYITLRTLSTLHLHSWDVDLFAVLLLNRHLTLPSLRDWTISGLCGQWPLWTWVDLCRSAHFGPHLKILRLRGHTFRANDVSDISADLLFSMAGSLCNLEILDLDSKIARPTLEVLSSVEHGETVLGFKSLRKVIVNGLDLDIQDIWGWLGTESLVVGEYGQLNSSKSPIVVT